MSTRIAVIGAGPAGFYATDQLLAKEFEVDLIDRLPTPFGLVRSGVAPDHPKIKTVTRVYEKTAKHPLFRFFGGLELGRDISRMELLERYHAVVYAYGTAEGTRLGIPGEELRGSHPATEFVGWYNGHPDFADHAFDFEDERAVVIGNGNVALDVARMLVLADEELHPTDTADHAIPHLCGAGVREVVLVGRRGPVQAAFTNPELRELGELTQADVIVDPRELELDSASAAWLESDEADITSRKNVEILRDYSTREPSGKSHRVVLRFLRSPVEILGDQQGRVRAIRLACNRLEQGPDGRMRAVPTGDGRGDRMRTGDARGRIPRPGDRGDPLRSAPRPDPQCRRSRARSRWRAAARRVRGRLDQARPIRSDRDQQEGRGRDGRGDCRGRRAVGKLGEPAIDDPSEVGSWLCSRGPRVVSWQGWLSIDERERRAGEPAGRPRVKLVRIEDMVDASGEHL